MDIVNGKGPKIAGAAVGDLVYVHLTTGKAEKIMLTAITRNGVEGVEVDLKSSPLTFYPFSNIIKIKKHTELV